MKKTLLTAVLTPLIFMLAGICITTYNSNKEKAGLDQNNNSSNRQTHGSFTISTPVAIKVSGQQVYVSMNTNRQTISLKV